jgi:hypothetical protein
MVLFLNVPGGHKGQVICPVRYRLFTHFSQLLVPVLFWYVKTGHNSQRLPPVLFWYLPGSHNEHSEKPELFE